MAGNSVRAVHFPDGHTLQSPPNFILRDGDRTLIANSAASFCSASWQASASSVSHEARIESVQLVGHRRVSSYHGSGYASKGADSPQSLPHALGVIEFEMILYLFPVLEFSGLTFVCGCAHIHRDLDCIIHS